MILIGSQALRYHQGLLLEHEFDIIDYSIDKVFILNNETYKIKSAMNGTINMMIYNWSYENARDTIKLEVGTVIVAPIIILKVLAIMEDNKFVMTLFKNIELDKYLSRLIEIS